MNTRIVEPLVLIASLVTLASCTKPTSETVVTPIATPEVNVEVVTPAPVTPTPTPTETATGTPVTSTPQTFTRKQVVSYRSPG